MATPFVNEKASPSLAQRFFGFLRARPILVMLFFSPGLIEYLSGSSPLELVVGNPPFFLFQLLLNVALYGPGVLLIREAMLRWKKGWASVLLLGFAYGILEEGVGLGTMFNSTSGPAVSAGLGTYGHFVGVNWVWAFQIAIVHSLFSISIPIVLLGLALPETRGRSLLGGRGVKLAFVVWALDILALILLVRQWASFFAGFPLILGSFVVIGALVLAAWVAPRDLLRPRPGPPSVRRVFFLAVGFAFYLAMILGADISKGIGLPPVFAIATTLGVAGIWLWWTLRHIGTERNETALVALIGGLYVIIMFGGVVSQIGLPIIIVGDAAFVLFLRSLWLRYSSQAASDPAQVGEAAPQEDSSP